VDPPRLEIHVAPAEREDFAGAQPGERAERVGDVQRLGERQIDAAANVGELLHERRRPRVVSRIRRVERGKF
jgi:hypothetical protein